MLGHVAAELADRPAEARRGWWLESGPLVSAILEQRPADALELAERWLTGPLPWAMVHRLGRLLAADPGRVVRLVLADQDRVARFARIRITRVVRIRLVGLPDAELGALLAATGPAERLLEAVLRGFAADRRPAVFELAHAGHDRPSLLLTERHLALLPPGRCWMCPAGLRTAWARPRIRSSMTDHRDPGCWRCRSRRGSGPAPAGRRSGGSAWTGCARTPRWRSARPRWTPATAPE